MKLFARYNRINLLFTIAIFIAGSIALSLLIRYLVNHQTDTDLMAEKDEMTTYVAQFKSLPPIDDARGEYTTYQSVTSASQQQPKFYTQKIWNKEEQDGEFVRSIEWMLSIGDKHYRVTISKSLDVTEDLIQSIIIITLILILLILVTGLVVNRVLLKRLWQPFYRSMETVQQFELNGAAQISLDKSNIDEFNLMNATLQKALNKAQNDYRTLKEFTENASHELQTPLAVISSKLDVLIQSEELTEKQSHAISGAYDAIKDTKKLNQSLLLLAKIENRQFSGQINLHLQRLLADKQEQFAEQLQSRHITMQPALQPVVVDGNPQLTDILLNNLFSNAIRHNVAGGFISLQLQPSRFTISNSGKPQPLEEAYVFNRFYKGNTGDVHHGLGLSIVKQICDVSGSTCRYQFIHPDTHSFIIEWQ